jgi:hypothetical protein
MVTSLLKCFGTPHQPGQGSFGLRGLRGWMIDIWQL